MTTAIARMMPLPTIAWKKSPDPLVVRTCSDRTGRPLPIT
jgi:hypothetical protein